MGKYELKREILSVEDVSKVIEFIVFGMAHKFISHKSSKYWKNITNEIRRYKDCGITYFKRTKDSFPRPYSMGIWILSQNAEFVLWQGFSPDEPTSPKTGRDVCWSLDNDFATFLEAIYEFKINHL